MTNFSGVVVTEGRRRSEKRPQRAFIGQYSSKDYELYEVNSQYRYVNQLARCDLLSVARSQTYNEQRHVRRRTADSSPINQRDAAGAHWASNQ